MRLAESTSDSRESQTTASTTWLGVSKPMLALFLL
jgi:hypothetical protein